MTELSEMKKFGRMLAEESGKIIRGYFRNEVGIEIKSDDTPVTVADKQAEQKMRELIMKEFPTHGILGEEFGDYQPDAEYRWVLDPIDGTKSFVCGTVTFGTLIALLKNGSPVMGIINQPVLNEFLIGDNNSAELNGKQVHVRKCDDISEAVLLTTDHLNIEKYQGLKGFEKLMRSTKLYRNWGDCYGYYLLATGYADIMIDPIMSPWDMLALIPVIKGAGGTITDYQGNDAVTGKSIVATGGKIHSRVISLLNEN